MTAALRAQVAGRSATRRTDEVSAVLDDLPELVRRELVSSGIEFRVAPRPADVFRCDDIARFAGLDPRQVVKTIVLLLDQREFVLAVAPGGRRISLGKIKRRRGARKIVIASPQQAEAATGQSIGGITPIGCRPGRPPALIDESVLELGLINVGSGRKDLGIELAARDLFRLADLTPADICDEDPDAAADDPVWLRGKEEDACPSSEPTT